MALRFGKRLIALAASSIVLGGPTLAQAPPTPAPAAASPAPAEGPQPRLAFDSVNVNIGEVVHGADAAATFTYHNTGDAPLHILSAHPG